MAGLLRTRTPKKSGGRKKTKGQCLEGPLKSNTALLERIAFDMEGLMGTAVKPGQSDRAEDQGS
jgi:hypothetical protein